VFQAGVYAIKACAIENLYKDYKTGNIYILLESQAAIKALDTYQFNSKLVWDCHQSLVYLAKHNTVQPISVSGQDGIEGNGTADKLAKLGAECPLIGPEPACGISARIARMLSGAGHTDAINNSGST
jgi:ribonuclease HI